jgi:tetratricopeptide (TPR) repeat protein
MARLAQRLGLTRYEADEHYKQALAFYNKKSMDEAILAMENAIALLPNSSEYYAARGFFYLEDGIPNKAAEDFEQALKLHPYETLAHYGRGLMAYNAKNWDEALAHFTDAYRADPKRAETLYYLALTLHHKRDNAHALPYMQKAAQLMDQAGDKRKRDADKWVKEFESLIEERRKQLTSGRHLPG